MRIFFLSSGAYTGSWFNAWSRVRKGRNSQRTNIQRVSHSAFLLQQVYARASLNNAAPKRWYRVVVVSGWCITRNWLSHCKSFSVGNVQLLFLLSTQVFSIRTRVNARGSIIPPQYHTNWLPHLGDFP
ncbi:unnamed protein product [Periconia digitata]|uniref:Uncharacterized protein n=1 Tax=Periconia digitata TaxID=1303443 RepID=A0A9W4XQ50_9PLEO|nr:unnamed protein product [Periconia digitata]